MFSKSPTPSAKAFVDYYNSNNIIPVRQDLTNLESFIFRRNYLYKTLGFPLSFLKGLDVIEFGPGGGYNAVATSYFQPRSYVFVEGSIASISELQKKRAAGDLPATDVEIIESDILDYRDSRKYDLVICEGVIPGQNDPAAMLKHVGSFCRKGGILVTTTTSASSVLSEICRRVLRPAIVSPNRTFLEQTALAANLFRNHLLSLATSTRPIEDWVQDVILQNLQKGEYVFTMLDSINALEDDFEFYSSSPRFLFDDRWYKQVNNSSATSNDLLREQHASISAFFLDFRIPLKAILQVKDVSPLAQIEPLSKLACAIHDKMVEENSFDRLDEFVAVLNDLTAILPGEFDVTKTAICDFTNGIRGLAMGDEKTDFGSFEKWWGRGQQYLSLINKHI